MHISQYCWDFIVFIRFSSHTWYKNRRFFIRHSAMKSEKLFSKTTELHYLDIIILRFFFLHKIKIYSMTFSHFNVSLNRTRNIRCNFKFVRYFIYRIGSVTNNHFQWKLPHFRYASSYIVFHANFSTVFLSVSLSWMAFRFLDGNININRCSLLKSIASSFFSSLKTT